MYCKNCGKLIDDDSNYCINCGIRLYHESANGLEFEEKNYEVPVESEAEEKNIASLDSEKTNFDKSSSISPNSEQNILEEFEPKLKIKISIRRIIGIGLSFLGCLFLAWDIAFSVLNIYPITENYYLGFRGFPIHTTKYHLLGYSLIFLFVASFLLTPTRLIINKTISIAIDGVALFLCLYLAEYFLIGSRSNVDIISYYLYFNVFSNRIFTWSLFLIGYYLIPEMNGGTIGKRIAGLISQNRQKKNLSIKQSLQKTLIYALPIWLMLIFITLNQSILNDLSESIVFLIFQWLVFVLFFISLFMIYISKVNYSLADFFSNTVVLNKKALVSNLNITTKVLSEKSNISGIEAKKISELHNLILNEKKKIFPRQNKLIIEKLIELIKDRSSFFVINKIYKNQYSKDIPEQLMSISKGYGIMYFYIEPLIKLEVCETDFPHKIIQPIDGENKEV